MSTKEKVVVGHVVSHTGKRGGPWEAQKGDPGTPTYDFSKAERAYLPDFFTEESLVKLRAIHPNADVVPIYRRTKGKQKKGKDSSPPGCSKTMSTKLADNIRENYKIVNIRRGKGHRSDTLYASLMDGDVLLISATLDYITQRLEEMTTPLPEEEVYQGDY